MLEPHPRHTGWSEINRDCRLCRVADRDREALRNTGYVYDPDRYFPNRMRSPWNPVLHLED